MIPALKLSTSSKRLLSPEFISSDDFLTDSLGFTSAMVVMVLNLVVLPNSVTTELREPCIATFRAWPQFMR